MDLISVSAIYRFGYGVAEFVIDEVVEIFQRDPFLVKGWVDADQLFLFVPAPHAHGAAFSPSRA